MAHRAFVRSLCFGLMLVLGLTGEALAQSEGGGASELARHVKGTVVDAATGEALPSATVQVVDTYVGTITNADGAFSLAVPPGATALRVRFVGYTPQEVPLPESPTGAAASVTVRLAPSPAALGEVVVTDENPAERIMRRVIAAKQRRNAAFATARADAYTRFTLRNDTGIVMMAESVTEAFWKRGEGVREVVKAQRVTDNLDLSGFIPAAVFVSNLYDDEIEVFGHTLRGVTHPDALRTYAFTLAGTQRLGESVVYAIDVQPRSSLASAFAGTVRVLGQSDALLDVALSPGGAFYFPPPIEAVAVTFYQQFSDFDGGDDAPWLPLDFRQEATLDIGMGPLLRFPTIHLDQVSRFSGYRVGAPVPDSLFAGEGLAVVDSVAVRAHDSAQMDAVAVPLTEAERVAYARIDSTDTVAEAFEPSGPLARFARISAGDGADDRGDRSRGPRLGIAPRLWFDRVSGAHLGAQVAPRLGPLTPRAQVAYATGPGRALYQVGARLDIPATRLFVEGSYADAIDRRYYGDLDRGRFTNGLAILLTGGSDGYDYYGSERLHVGAGVETQVAGRRVFVRAKVQREDHRSLRKTTSYDLLGDYFGEDPLRGNPMITPGRLGSVVADAVVGERGPDFGFVARPRVWLRAEVAREGFLGSAFEFVHLSGIVAVRVPTLFRGRLQPNQLDVRIGVGYAPGALPPQRFTLVETRGGALPGAPGIATRATPLYEGDRHVTLYAQHDFRTVPFELIGWEWAVRKGWGMALHVAGGRTWLHDENEAVLLFEPLLSDGVFAEAGISLSRVFEVVRFDVTTRLDQRSVSVGLGFDSPF